MLVLRLPCGTCSGSGGVQMGWIRSGLGMWRSWLFRMRIGIPCWSIWCGAVLVGGLEYNYLRRQPSIQNIVLHLDTLRAQGKPVVFHWIPSHKDVKGNEEAEIAAKEATGWRGVKRRNGKWREWDWGYTSKEQKRGRSRATINLALEQNTLKQWELA